MALTFEEWKELHQRHPQIFRPPDKLTSERMALGQRAGETPLPQEPVEGLGRARTIPAPSVPVREPFFGPIPEWQQEAYHAREERQVPGAGMRRYVPPTPPPAKPEERRPRAPGLEPLPWIVPIAGETGIDRRKEAVPGVAPGKPPRPLSITEKYKQDQMTMRANIRARAKKIGSITGGGVRATKDIGISDLRTLMTLLEAQEVKMPTIKEPWAKRESWYSFRRTIPADIRKAKNLDEAIKLLDEIIIARPGEITGRRTVKENPFGLTPPPR